MATLSTSPTLKGQAITVYDRFYPAKRINRLSLANHYDELWLLVLEAELKGLISIQFGYPDNECTCEALE